MALLGLRNTLRLLAAWSLATAVWTFISATICHSSTLSLTALFHFAQFVLVAAKIAMLRLHERSETRLARAGILLDLYGCTFVVATCFAVLVRCVQSLAIHDNEVHERDSQHNVSHTLSSTAHYQHDLVHHIHGHDMRSQRKSYMLLVSAITLIGDLFVLVLSALFCNIGSVSSLVELKQLEQLESEESSEEHSTCRQPFVPQTTATVSCHQKDNPKNNRNQKQHHHASRHCDIERMPDVAVVTATRTSAGSDEMQAAKNTSIKESRGDNHKAKLLLTPSDLVRNGRAIVFVLTLLVAPAASLLISVLNLATLTNNDYHSDHFNSTTKVTTVLVTNMDPIVSIVIACLYIAYFGKTLLMTLRLLAHAVPNYANAEEIRRDLLLLKDANIVGVHELFIYEWTPYQLNVSLHLVVLNDDEIQQEQSDKHEQQNELQNKVYEENKRRKMAIAVDKVKKYFNRQYPIHAIFVQPEIVQARTLGTQVDQCYVDRKCTHNLKTAPAPDLVVRDEKPCGHNHGHGNSHHHH